MRTPSDATLPVEELFYKVAAGSTPPDIVLQLVCTWQREGVSAKWAVERIVEVKDFNNFEK